jgi:Ser/Thr protein kinase RdoA (MazF antagonist)
MLNRIESTRPNLPPAELADIGRRIFGVAGEVRPLTSERDQNAVIVDGTAAYVLKVASAGDDPELIRLQNTAMTLAGGHESRLPVPRVVQSKHGNSLEFIEFGGKRHAVRLLTRLPGEPLSSLQRTSGLRQAAGTAAAHMDQALAVLAERQVNDMPWDMTKASAMRAGLPQIAAADQRRALELVLDDADAVTLPALAALPVQWIHNDFNLNNLLADPARPDRLSGIIDFGDILQTARVVEVAIAAVHLGAREPLPLEAATEVIAAYHRVSRLDEREIALLPRLMVLRATMAILGQEIHVARSGIGHFDLKHQENNYRFIALLSSTGLDAMGERFGNLLASGDGT